MEISTDKPPFHIHERCSALFDLSQSTPVFTVGDTIYNPLDGQIGTDVIAHEFVHAQQQGNDPEGWWEDYLTVPKFRFRQELEAYREQWKYAQKIIRDRNDLSRYLHSLACDLANPMYGSLCTVSEARALIKGSAMI